MQDPLHILQMLIGSREDVENLGPTSVENQQSTEPTEETLRTVSSSDSSTNRPRSIGSLEDTFRFFHRRKNYNDHCIKKEFNSLDYDKCENEIFLNSIKRQNFSIVSINTIRRYLNFILIGIVMGVMGALMKSFIDFTTHRKNTYVSNYVNACPEGDCLYTVPLVWMGINMFIVFIGSFIAVYIEPKAAGGGVAGVMGFLNGVEIPNSLTFSVVFYKSISAICTCVSGICAGKEGPMIHIGASMGAVLLRVPLICNYVCRPFRNETELRDLVAAGAACGVAVAFGAPLGGFLLTIEESISFLNRALLFRVFLASLFSVGVMRTLESVMRLEILPGAVVQKELLYIGKLEFDDLYYTILETPLFILYGVIAGLVGAVTVILTRIFDVFRRSYIKKKWLKITEALLVTLVTGLIHMALTYLWKGCRKFEEPVHAIKLRCKEGYTEFSVFAFMTPEEFLPWIVHQNFDELSIEVLVIMFFVFFGLSLYTVGISIAVGVFIPNLLVGALWGRCLATGLKYFYPDDKWIRVKKYTFLGAAAQLAGTIRITLSVIVIMIETSANTELIMPLMLTLVTARWVGNCFTPSIFEQQVIFQGMPFLHVEPPAFSCEIPIQNIMAKPVLTIPAHMTVIEIINLLNSHDHNGFPVVDRKNSLIGLVLTSQLLVLLKYKIFGNTPIDYLELDKIFNKEFRKNIKIQEIRINDQERYMNVNLYLVMNPSPYAVRPHMSLDRVYCLFRATGLRHVVVVDEKYKVVGMVTRLDLARYHTGRKGIIRLPLC